MLLSKTIFENIHDVIEFLSCKFNAFYEIINSKYNISL